MLNFEHTPKRIEKIFKKHSGPFETVEMDRDIRHLESDLRFIQELIHRTKTYSSYRFEPRLTLSGTIMNGFMHKINSHFFYYDIKYLEPHLYIYKILVKLFDEYWIDGVGIDEKKVKEIMEFNAVVKYYLHPQVKRVEDYVADFIGPNYGIREFMKVVKKLRPGRKSKQEEY